MPIWRLQLAMAGDTGLPRDDMVITPHFNDVGITTDPQQLCEDLATGFAALSVSNRQVRVKAYDAQGTAPVYPQGDFTANEGDFPASTCPREVATCFSFYAGQNIPTRRGRLFIPYTFSGQAANSVRIPLGYRESLGAQLEGLFSGLGGVDVDWSVYSRKDDEAHQVTNWWMDDEWDTMRSRGLRPETRVTGTSGG